MPLIQMKVFLGKQKQTILSGDFKSPNSFLETKACQVKQNANKDRFGNLYRHDLNLVFCRGWIVT